MPFPTLTPTPTAPTAGDPGRVLPGAAVGAFFESASGHTIVIAEPAARPDLWTAYLEGARESYRRHGVESALELDGIRDGRSTALFVAALTADGRVVAGARMVGRLARPDQASVLREWDGRPGTAEIRAQLGHRLPSGVIEVKAAWVGHEPAHRGLLTAAIARTFVHAMDLLQARYAICSAAAHAVTRWQTSGGVVAAEVPAVAYPDDRYRTLVLWWDRTRIADTVTPAQHDALTRESDLLFGRDHLPSTLPSVA